MPVKSVKTHPHPPARPLQPEDREDDEERQREDALEAAEDGVDRVPAVELPERQQVQRRHEEPEPRGEEDRMLDDVHARVRRAGEELLEELDEDRVLEDHGPFRERGGRIDPRVRDAPREKGDGHGEPGDRARHGHVEELALVADLLADADEGAHRPDEGDLGRKGDEVRRRRVDAVAAAHQIVAELVRQEDGQKGKREHEPFLEEPGIEERGRSLDSKKKRRTKSGREDDARVRGRQERHREEQSVKPPPLLPPRRGGRRAHPDLAHELRRACRRGAGRGTRPSRPAPRAGRSCRAAPCPA